MLNVNIETLQTYITLVCDCLNLHIINYGEVSWQMADETANVCVENIYTSVTELMQLSRVS